MKFPKNHMSYKRGSCHNPPRLIGAGQPSLSVLFLDRYPKLTRLYRVSGFLEMNDHGDEAKAQNCSNYAANDGEEYRNTASFKHDEF
jgi:hypothetical protein